MKNARILCSLKFTRKPRTHDTDTRGDASINKHQSDSYTVVCTDAEPQMRARGTGTRPLPPPRGRGHSRAAPGRGDSRHSAGQRSQSRASREVLATLGAEEGTSTSGVAPTAQLKIAEGAGVPCTLYHCTYRYMGLIIRSCSLMMRKILLTLSSLLFETSPTTNDTTDYG